MKNVKQLTLLVIYLISSAVAFIATLIIHLLATFVDGIFGPANTAILIITLILTVVFGFFAIFFFIAVIRQSEFLKRLAIQNTYAFGKPVTFYDISAFKNRALKLNRIGFYKKRKQCIIAFTPASLDVSENSFRNDDVTTLNYELALAISNYFESQRGYWGKRYNIFGFDRGVFLVYSFNSNDEFIKGFITEMTNRIFSITAEKGLKVWVQPFFGVRITKPEDNLTSAIEDALVARNNGELNFESYTIFTKETSEEEGSVRLKEIKEAIDNDEFVPYYQPKYNLKKKEFVSCEVLARWQSPTRGLLAPNTFIHKAEQYGLLTKIDLIIFEKSLRDLSNSIKRGRRVIPISANFSLYEFFSHSFLDTIMDLLAKYQVPPTLVEIEITESTSQVNQFLSISIIKKLKDKGIRVLMDDYGVGYSQIENFKNIPFDGIKIDKSYTDEVLTDEKVKSIIRFLVELGHVNDLEVIVEGVEKKEQVDALRKMHVDTIQGFYYSKPLSCADYEALLKENKFEGGAK